jgi:hypothetical protein
LCIFDFFSPLLRYEGIDIVRRYLPRVRTYDFKLHKKKPISKSEKKLLGTTSPKTRSVAHTRIYCSWKLNSEHVALWKLWHRQRRLSFRAESCTAGEES